MVRPPRPGSLRGTTGLDTNTSKQEIDFMMGFGLVSFPITGLDRGPGSSGSPGSYNSPFDPHDGPCPSPSVPPAAGLPFFRTASCVHRVPYELQIQEHFRFTPLACNSVLRSIRGTGWPRGGGGAVTGRGRPKGVGWPPRFVRTVAQEIGITPLLQRCRAN